MNFYQQQLDKLDLQTQQKPLDQIRRGIEKENLRVDTGGQYVTTPHPEDFGSALTHPFITTDFSESLLECVTSPVHCRQRLFNDLQNILAWVTQSLQKKSEPEFLWPYSMPYLETDEQVNDVPIANYGNSNAARMKRIYRKGLVSRYGNAMQLIAGIHYNISYPAKMLQQLGALPDFPAEDGQALISQRYMGLIRNFIRYQWVLAYLFGSSPACFSASLRKKRMPVYLQPNQWEELIAKNGCSLRLGDLGYQNSAQASIQLSFESVEKYAKDLLMATKIPDSRLFDSDVKAVNGEYKQLNRNLLQIENEYYFNIRPKASPQASQGERPAVGLYNHGVEYIEFRGLDLDPLNPLGLSPETSAFCDLFLFYLLLKPSSVLSNCDKMLGAQNLKGIVQCGRHAHSKVIFRDRQMLVCDALLQLFDEMEPLAQWMDEADSSSENTYSNALMRQRKVATGEGLNLSGIFMEAWSATNLSLRDFLLQQQQAHADSLLSHALPDELKKQWQAIAEKSRQEQNALEQDGGLSFEAYLDRYFSQKLG